MISRLQVENYRSLADVDVELEPLTVLVGPNGSGKSNFIDALRFVADALQLGLDVAVNRRGGMSSLRRWADKKNTNRYQVVIRLHFEPSVTAAMQGEYVFALNGAKHDEYHVVWERCTLQMPSRSPAEFEVRNGQWDTYPFAPPPVVQPRALSLPLLTGVEPYGVLYDFLTGMSFYNILPSILHEPQKVTQSYPLEEHGKNLASLLREMNRSNGKYLQDLKSALRRIDDISDFQVRKVGEYLVTRLLHREASTSAVKRFELFQESDGTLRVFGILAALYQAPPRTLIGVEEPELNIHPGAMGFLWEELEAAGERSQVIITTHSPDLLDMCRAEQLRVVEKIEGITHIDPLEEAQKEIIRKRLFAPGQLLQAQGLYRAEEK